MPINGQMLSNYTNNVFIETGTNIGNTVNRAIKVGFKTIYSIEVNQTICEQAQERFKHLDFVHILCGESTKILPEILKQVDEPATFWLDAHFSRKKDIAVCSLMKELEIIRGHHIHTHTILIDDVRLFGGMGIDVEAVFTLLRAINDKYTISYLNSPAIKEWKNRVHKNDILAATL